MRCRSLARAFSTPPMRTCSICQGVPSHPAGAVSSLGCCQEVDNIPHPKHSPQEPLEPIEPPKIQDTEVLGKDDGVEELGKTEQIVEPDGLQSVNQVPEVVEKVEEPQKPPDEPVEPELPTEVISHEQAEPEIVEEIPQAEFMADPPTEEATEEPDEVIPSFKEFRERKEKEESEKGKSKAQTDRQKNVNEEEVESEDEKPKPKGKLIQKNYADIVCGAKIADNKKDFKNAASVLNKDKDSYAMIPCEGSIWFVVELCDTIQITAIQLANFELFASSIHEFKVYTSEAYPPKEWTHIGTFAAKNKREMEKFEISGHGQYGKYVKFEKISHRGKEHFCVLTAFQVLGMSMVDEYEEQQAQPETIDPYELPIDSFDATEPSDVAGGDKSLIVGAKNAVKNIVDSALGVLGVTNKEGEEGVVAPVPTEDPPAPTPAPDPVVVKVDERGKEIKVEEEKKTEGEEKRSKGEEGGEVKKQPTVVIMEGVDLAEEKKADDIVAPAAPVVVEPATPAKEVPDVVPVVTAEKGETLPVPVVEPKEEPKEEVKKETPKKETPPKVEQKEEVPATKPAADVPQQQPVAADLKDSKGVVMTNSPKKNSIFLELDKRIKELERNLSLSNDYLETLSSRYKKVDNLFKPLEKTLATVDEAMKQFEDRLGQIEARFESIQGMLADIQERASDIGGKSNSLITTTNLILFILLLAFYFIWRMSKKVNEISGVFEERRAAARIARPMSPTAAGALCGGNEENRKQKKTRQVRSKSRDTSPMPPPHGGIRGARSETQINRRISAPETKKTPLESLQMDLIYPQPKAPQLKNRKTKHHVR
eukprot:sb/3462122/